MTLLKKARITQKFNFSSRQDLCFYGQKLNFFQWTYRLTQMNTDKRIKSVSHFLLRNKSIESLDREASRVGVTRQSIIKVWLAERLEELAANKTLRLNGALGGSIVQLTTKFVVPVGRLSIRRPVRPFCSSCLKLG
jgi:hypothetical protein